MRLGLFMVSITGVFVSCIPYKERATGPQNQIVVVVSADDKRLVTPILDSLFSRAMYTPEPEPYFVLVFRDPSGFKDVKTSHNLAVVSLFSPADTTGDRLVRNLLPSRQMQMALEGENQVFSARDLFAREQAVLIVAAKDAREFRGVIHERGPWIFSKFDEAFLERQEAHIFNTLEQKNLSRRLQNDYGWNLRIQHDYVILTEDSARNFVKLGRSFPYRWISVHWTDRPPEKDLDIASVTKEVSEFPHLYFDHIDFTRRYRQVERIEFGRWGAFRVEGLWERTNEQKGGPLVSYLFYDPNTDRRFHINLLIYFPGGEKLILMRQMEVVARTFSVEPP